MLIDIITRVRSTALGGSIRSRHRLAAGLVAAATVLLTTAGSAAAYTPTPLNLNAPTWSAKACCGAGAPGWYKDGFGIIHLQGAVTQTVSGGSTRIGTLPPAARPTREVFTIVHTYLGTFADLAIAPNGQIGVIAPRPPAVAGLKFVSLEGVTYQPANQIPVTPIEINQTNWTTNPTQLFGSTAPAWYKDGSGIVHLEGATKQWFAGSGGSSVPALIGAVPAAAVPVRPVATIVHTAFGTYADLTILTTGQIYITPPPTPLATDFSFVSLEGVTYQPGALFNHIANLNTNNWKTAFSGEDPGWVQDSTGVVHLQGAATQTSSGGAAPYFVGRLPAIIAPTRTVFTIVATNAGTYADLAITPDGAINVISPQPPAIQNLLYLWLDGVTYQR